MKFWENDYRMTCSIGACFLPENTAGYSFDQLFENADWALYQAKQNGRNQYVICGATPRRFLPPRKQPILMHATCTTT